MVLIGPPFFEKLNLLTSQNIISRYTFEFSSLLPEFNKVPLRTSWPLTPVQGVQTLSDKSNLLILPIQSWSIYDSLGSN